MVNRSPALPIDRLTRALRPRSLAMVGASETRGTLISHVFDNLRKDFPTPVRVVNPKIPAVFGEKTFPSVSALPPTDLIVVMVAAARVPDIIAECAQAGHGGAYILSAGFVEAGPAGAQLQQQITQIAEAHSFPVFGPNCVGYLNRFEGVMANFSLRPDQARPKPGPVGLISQSGGVGSTLLSRLMEHGVGVGLFATTGNECHMTASDLLQFFIEQPEMSIVGVFAETIGRPEVFVRAAQRAAELDKPIIAMRPPKSEAAARAALAHTGSTVVSPEVFDAVCDQYGVLRVPSIDNFVDLSVILQNGRRMRGRKVAVVTMSGGAGVLIAGEAQEQGLEVNVLGPSTEQKIAAITPPFAGTKNPVDTTPALNPWSAFRDVIEILLQDAEIDVVLVYIWGPENQLAEMVIAAYGATDKPVATIATENPEGMSAKGVPSFGDPARAARALVALHKISVRRPFAPEPAFSPDVARRERVRTILSVRSMVSGAEARRAISEYGIAFIDETSYATEDEDVAGSGIEFALGMLRDPDFGPMVALRVGRSSAPLAQVLLRAPVGQAQVLAAVERLTDPRVERFSQSVHIGWREQLATAVCAIGAFALEQPQVASLDVEPILVSPAGVNALGAVIVQSPPGEHQTPGRDNRGPTPRLG